MANTFDTQSRRLETVSRLRDLDDDELDLTTLEEHYPSQPLLRGVRVNMACSLDGVIALDGRSQALSGKLDKVIFRFLRSTATAIVVGAGTAKAERYGPVAIATQFALHRAKIEGVAPSPPLVIIGTYREQDLSWLERLRDPSNPTHIALYGMSSTRNLGEGLINDARDFDLQTPVPLVSHLLNNAPSPILCEGGPSLLTTLINAGLVEEICLSQSHLFAGRSSAVLVNDLDSGPIHVAIQARLESTTHTFTRLIIEDRDPRRASERSITLGNTPADPLADTSI